MDTTWMPYMWPIKTCLLIGIAFLLIQLRRQRQMCIRDREKGEWPGENK